MPRGMPERQSLTSSGNAANVPLKMAIIPVPRQEMRFGEAPGALVNIPLVPLANAPSDTALPAMLAAPTVGVPRKLGRAATIGLTVLCTTGCVKRGTVPTDTTSPKPAALLTVPSEAELRSRIEAFLSQARDSVEGTVQVARDIQAFLRQGRDGLEGTVQSARSLKMEMAMIAELSIDLAQLHVKAGLDPQARIILAKASRSVVGLDAEARNIATDMFPNFAMISDLEGDQVRSLCKIAKEQFKSGFRQDADISLAASANIRTRFADAARAFDKAGAQGGRAEKDKVLNRAADLAGISEDIATTQAEMGLYAAAIETASGIADGRPSFREIAFSEIALVQARAGSYDDALKTLSRAGVPASQTSTLIEIATLQAQAGLVEAAKATVARVDAVVSDIRYAPDRRHVLTELAGIKARIGMIREAIAILNDIRQDVASTKDDWEKRPALSSVANAFMEVALAQGKLGQRIDAQVTIREVFRLTGEDAEGLRKIALVLAQSGFRQEATEAFAKLLSLADKMKKDYERLRFLEDAAESMAKADFYGDAIRIMDRIAAESGRDHEESEAWREIAVALARAGRYGEAIRDVENVPRYSSKAAALLEIVRIQHARAEVPRTPNSLEGR
jgi:tetratricopeptide (TPR) repeat protein